MKKKIDEIADISFGYQPKGKVEPVKDSQYRLLQIKDFDDNLLFDPENLTTFLPEKETTPFTVHKGDVLFLARGHKNWSVCIDINIPNMVATVYFFILRNIKSDILTPAYLSWYLNQSPAQSYIQTIARRGSHMPIVSIADFKDLTVNLPDLETQSKIVALYDAAKNEKLLQNKIVEKREQLLNAVSIKLIK